MKKRAKVYLTEAEKQCHAAYNQFKREREIQGLDIKCIPEPPPIEQIDGYGKSIDERIFKRIHIPEVEFKLDEHGDVIYSYFKDMDDEYEQEVFIPMLMEKRTEGHFFFCRDQLEYITGDHWYYLNVVKIPIVKTIKGIRRRVSDHPFFVDADRDFFLYWRQAEVASGCFGIIFTASRRVGKALDVNTPIPTPDGFKKMLDIHEGDYVFGKDGKPALVTYVTEVQHNRTVNRVWFDDRTYIDADDDHQWEVTHISDRRKYKDKCQKRVVTTKEIKEEGLIKIVGGKPERIWHIDLNEAVEYFEKELPIDPYLFGYWLGDGSAENLAITTSEEDIYHIESVIKVLGFEYSIKRPKKRAPFIRVFGGREMLRSAGVFGNKHIPEIYKHSSIEQRKEFVRGFMDADGYTSSATRAMSEITQKNKKIIDDFVEIMRSLGEKMVISEKTAKIKSINFECQVYRTSFNASFNPHKMERKASQWKKAVSARRKIKSIEKIEQIESIPVKCISVESEGNVYLAGSAYTVTHNTFKGLSILMNNATMIPEALCGIQAQNGNMAGSIFKRLVKMWRKLNRHWLFYPAHKGNSDPKDALEFTQPSRRSTKIQYFNYEDTLESKIDFRSTTENAYDSEGVWRLYIDEASKMENCNIMDLYNIVREVLADGSTALGKMLITSTAENLGGKTLKQYETLWKESDIKTMDAFGTTKSGLYRYFQPATRGYRHSSKEDGSIPKELNKPTIDKWGYSDEETARKVLMYLRENKSGDSLIHFIRKYPLNSKEAFMYAEVVSPLDINRINHHIVFNEEIESLRKITVRGELDWLHGVPDTEVVWIPKEDGMWEMFMLPDEEDRNKFSSVGNSRTPAVDLFVSSCDPFSHKIVQDEKRMSMAGSHVMTVSGGKYPNRTFVMQYHGRRSDPNDFFEDMIKQCVFYSCKILPENQKYEIINYFSKRGYAGYIERNPLNEKKEELGISTRGEDTRTQMVNGLSSYVKQEVGQQADGSYKDQPFQRLLEDWRDFEPENWTKYDLTVSSMICIIMNLKKKEKKPTTINLSGMIKRYDIKGR